MKPHVTVADIFAKIKKSAYLNHEVLTVCVLTLENGFIVTGKSACASPENFNKTLGEKYAYENAVEKIWELEGYLLREKLYQASLVAQ